jgi:mRNA-degrading endonuclease toxin of MazEF toxin-antitoxin module
VNILRAGRSLIIRDRKMGTHLWFVLTDPDAETRLVVIVVLVTERAHTETSVRLDVGDHPFIKHASNVDFGSATYALAVKLEAALASKRAEVSADMSPELLAKVRQGLVESSHTPNEIVAYCRKSFGL